MPFIHIQSLPLEQPIDVSAVVAGVASDFSARMDIELFHIHTTWTFFQPGHYAKGDATPEHQPVARHPIVVDVLTPDFNDTVVIENMLETIAKSLSTRAEFPVNNIFINHRKAHSGMVFDDGKIVHW